MRQSINQRINPTGATFRHPVLRWIPGRVPETLHVEELDNPTTRTPGGNGMTDYGNPDMIWFPLAGADLDYPLTDREWECLVFVVGLDFTQPPPSAAFQKRMNFPLARSQKKMQAVN